VSKTISRPSIRIVGKLTNRYRRACSSESMRIFRRRTKVPVTSSTCRTAATAASRFARVPKHRVHLLRSSASSSTSRTGGAQISLGVVGSAEMAMVVLLV
jgi:hypothetical protein